MSLITRTYTFTDGTTAYGSQVDSEIANIVNTINNLNTAAQTWGQVSILNATSVPLIVDNSTGSQDIADFKVNGVIKVSISGTGVMTTANGIANSNSNITMASTKVTGLAAGSANGDSIRYEQVNQLWGYRRPVLQYSSSTVVNLETGNLGTSGQATILFPDGTIISDSTSGHINCNLAQVASTGGSPQSGIRTGTVSNNTWYAIYAVKANSGASFVTIADTVLPIQANFATLNSNFTANSWVYLGLIRYGDGAGTANAVVSFSQAGNTTRFSNNATATVNSTAIVAGMEIANATGGASAAFTYTAGTSGNVLPNNIGLASWLGISNAGSARTIFVKSGGGGRTYVSGPGGGATFVSMRAENAASDGVSITLDSSTGNFDLFITGFVDTALGVGPSPVL